MNTSPDNATLAPLYHWTEWPLAVLVAVLMGVAVWHAPGPDRHVLGIAAKSSVVGMGCWAVYIEWRRGALSRGVADIRRGIEEGEEPFLWLHRRWPLRLVWATLTVLGMWHF